MVNCTGKLFDKNYIIKKKERYNICMESETDSIINFYNIISFGSTSCIDWSLRDKLLHFNVL